MTKGMLLAIILGLAVATGAAIPLDAQEAQTSSGARLEGKVQKVDRAKSLIVVKYDNVTREVIYDESTRFTVLNQPGSLDAVKEGRPVICRGKLDGRNRLIAFRVDVQDRAK